MPRPERPLLPPATQAAGARAAAPGAEGAGSWPCARPRRTPPLPPLQSLLPLLGGCQEEDGTSDLGTGRGWQRAQAQCSPEPLPIPWCLCCQGCTRPPHGSVPCCNTKLLEQGTGRPAGPGQDGSGRSRPPNSKFISSPARRGQGSVVLVSQGSHAPSPPAGPQLPGPSACPAPCRLGHRKPPPGPAPCAFRLRGALRGEGCAGSWGGLCFAWGGRGGAGGASVLWWPRGLQSPSSSEKRGGSGSIDRGGILSV